MVVPTVSLGCPRIKCCTAITSSIIERSHGTGSVIEHSHGTGTDSVDGDGRAMEAKVDVVADLAGKEGALAADEVVDVNQEAVRIIEEVVGCRANVDAKCGGIKG